MAWPTVAVTEISDRWRPLTPAETSVATKRIADAEGILQYHLRTRGVLEAPVGDAPWAALYTQIVADMVLRLLQNPDGWVEQTEAVDDYRKTLRRAGDTAPSTLYIDEAELAMLLPSSKRRRRSFSIHLGQS